MTRVIITTKHVSEICTTIFNQSADYYIVFSTLNGGIMIKHTKSTKHVWEIHNNITMNDMHILLNVRRHNAVIGQQNRNSSILSLRDILSLEHDNDKYLYREYNESGLMLQIKTQ